jgi:DNA-binding XRE family transcriptional regulator
MAFSPDTLRRIAKCSPAETRGIAEQRSRGELLRARAAAGFTQLQLAMAIGVARQTVEDWERGAARVPAWALQATEAFAQMRKAAT